MAIKPFLEVGKIVNTQGLKGEVKVQPWCDDPQTLAGFHLLYFDDQGKTSKAVEHARVQKSVVILQLDGVTSLTLAKQLVGCTLYINREAFSLPEGTYFVQDLLGIFVYDVDCPDVCYGKLVEVLKPGANEVYRLVDERGLERLVPVIPEVVIRVEPQKARMEIRPLKGLFDDENGSCDPVSGDV